jgi:peptide chain release factor 1
MIEKLKSIAATYNDLNAQMSNPDIMSDMDKFKKVSKRLKDLEPIILKYTEYKTVLENIDGNKQLLADASTDLELKEMAEMELEELEASEESLEAELKLLLVPKDPNDSLDAIMEIRAGTGGDEAGIFAGDLYRMYSKFIEDKGWKQEVISLNEAEKGGFKEIVFAVRGEQVYAHLKFESGVHRVQRVPDTETQGRVHTSAATVAVLLESDEIEVEINDNDLRIDVYRSSGNGGQSVNTTDSAVRITHIPTNTVVTCQDEKSQLKNKLKAMKHLKAKLYDFELQKQQESMKKERQQLVSSGDRSAKIRTYNFPQGRFTDHRIGLTLYNLDKIMDGHISDAIEQLRMADITARMGVQVEGEL